MPFMKFYPQDWRADEKLRLCSLAARGLWLEMLAIMHRSERYGQLLIGGHVPTDAQLAVQVGASPPEVSALVAELSAAGVFSRTASGAIYSRRMTRDHRVSQNARKNGRKGGNPSLCKNKSNSEGDNLPDKPPLKPRSQRPDSVPTGTAAKPPDDPIKAVFDLGVRILTEGGKSEQQARKLVGMWRKDHGAAEMLDGLEAAASKTDPASWLMRRFAGGGQAASIEAMSEHAARLGENRRKRAGG